MVAVMRRELATTVVVVFGFCAAAAADTDLRAVIQAHISVETGLLDESLDRYRTTRERQEQAERRASQLASRLDRLLEDATTPVTDLHELEVALSLTRRTAAAAAEESSGIRRAIYEHLRRIELLRQVAGESAGEEAKIPDPISGRWSVRVLPYDQQGFFDLDLDGTLVSGSYSLDGGYGGSLRGTFVNGVVELERIDSEHGFDIIYTGRLAEGEARLDGSWQSTLLNAPGPTGGSWVAFKVADDIDGDR